MGTLDNPLSHNLYTYCANNPLIYIDPSGHNNIPSSLEGFNTLNGFEYIINKNIPKYEPQYEIVGQGWSFNGSIDGVDFGFEIIEFDPVAMGSEKFVYDGSYRYDENYVIYGYGPYTPEKTVIEKIISCKTKNVAADSISGSIQSIWVVGHKDDFVHPDNYEGPFAGGSISGLYMTFAGAIAPNLTSGSLSLGPTSSRADASYSFTDYKILTIMPFDTPETIWETNFFEGNRGAN